MQGLATVGVVCDFAEEAWASMELAAELVLSNSGVLEEAGFRTTGIQPVFQRRLTRVPGLASQRRVETADRLVNRFWDYPRALRRIRTSCDLFHIVDHSYAHLARDLPRDRVVVTCHDLDAIRCLVDPLGDPRPRWYQLLAGRILAGLQRAAAVICDSAGTRSELLHYGLLPAERVTVVSLGVHPAHSPEPHPRADREAERLLGPRLDGTRDLLHVGTTVPRKNIETLLHVTAAVREVRPAVRLVRVGGAFTEEHERLTDRLGLRQHIVVLPYLDREVLSAVYRRAAAVLLPSWREGFGLPVVEAMACGTPVVASGLPVLHEVGGQAAEYCDPGDVQGWRQAIIRLLAEQDEVEAWAARRQSLLARASLYDWQRQAAGVAEVYRRVLTTARTVGL